MIAQYQFFSIIARFYNTVNAEFIRGLNNIPFTHRTSQATDTDLLDIYMPKKQEPGIGPI